MPTTLDLMEYPNDAAAQAAYVSSDAYGSDICTGGAATASSTYNTYVAGNAFDDNEGTRWISAQYSEPPQWIKYNLGVGVTKVVGKLRLKDAHAWIKDFILQGSNNDSDWDNIYTGQVAQNNNWQEFTFPNSTAYRYYRFYMTSDWGDPWGASIWEMEMMEIHLQCYSEDTIKQQGYSLKGFARKTESLNDTLIRTVDPTIDLTGKDRIKFSIRASRIGSNIKAGIRDLGGVTTEHTPNILVANTWQSVQWYIGNLAKLNKDAIDRITFTIINADSDNIFYIDDIQAYGLPTGPILV